MKRIMVYIVVLALSLAVPEYGTDVGKLIPVELVFLYREADQIVIETDVGEWGRGETVDAAVRDMHESASGEVFLDTAEYLLIEEPVLDQMDVISGYLKGCVRVCKAQRGLDLQEAARYLDAHRPEMKLKVAKTAEITEQLKQIGGKLKLS